MNTQVTCPALDRAAHGDLLYYRRQGPRGTVVELGTVAGTTMGADGHAAYVSFTQQAQRYSAPFLARMPENADLVRLISDGVAWAKHEAYDKLLRQPKLVEVSGSNVRVWPKSNPPELTICED